MTLPDYTMLLVFLSASVVTLGLSKFALDHPLYDGPHWTQFIAFYLWQASRASMWMVILFAALRAAFFG